MSIRTIPTRTTVPVRSALNARRRPAPVPATAAARHRSRSRDRHGYNAVIAGYIHELAAAYPAIPRRETLEPASR